MVCLVLDVLWNFWKLLELGDSVFRFGIFWIFGFFEFVEILEYLDFLVTQP